MKSFYNNRGSASERKKLMTFCWKRTSQSGKMQKSRWRAYVFFEEEGGRKNLAVFEWLIYETPIYYQPHPFLSNSLVANVVCRDFK